MSHRYGPPLIAGAHIHGVPGLGVLGSLIPATGEHGPGYAYDDLIAGDETREIRGLITTWPTNGTLTAYEDTSFEYDGASDAFAYQLYVDGVARGSVVTHTITIGAVDEEAAGTVAALLLSAPTGPSAFVAASSGAIDELALTPPAGASAVASDAAGTIDELSLSAPTGASATEYEITASGGFALLSLSAPVGNTAVISSVTGAFAQILLTAPIGNSSTVVAVSATGQISALALVEPFGNTAVFALPVGAFVEISLSTPSAISGTGSLEELVYQLLANRQELDPVLGEFLVYDADGVTVKWRARAWEDAEATQPYRGGALRRIDKLELL